ncbi:MAG: twin-arginine translocase subunit TatC [Acidimicrobiales bacterium]
MAIKLPLRRGPRPDPDSMTLIEHLGELRRRLIIAILALLVGGVVAFALYNPILAFLRHPYCELVPKGHSCTLLATSVTDGLSLRFKVAVYGGGFLGSPVIFWQLWRFVTPGLRASEKRYAIPFIAASVVLFSAGAGIAYLVFVHALQFLRAVGGPSLTYFYTAPSYLNFILLLMAAFGAAFEFPVVLVGLQLAHVVTPARLAKWRRWAIVIIFAVVALLIPSGDPFSMLAMAIPLVLFYEGAIIVGRLLGR